MVDSVQARFERWALEDGWTVKRNNSPGMAVYADRKTQDAYLVYMYATEHAAELVDAEAALARATANRSPDAGQKERFGVYEARAMAIADKIRGRSPRY